MTAALGGKDLLRPQRRRRSAGQALKALLSRPLAFPVILLAIVMVGVLVPVVLQSFQRPVTLLTSTWSLASYGRLFSSATASAFAYSFGFAIASSLLATGIGLAIAWTLTRFAVPLKGLFEILAYVPFFLSTVILSTAWALLGSPQTGFLSRLLTGVGLPPLNVYSPAGIVWVLTIANVPLVVMLCSSTLRQMDASLEQASRAAGAGPLTTALKVTFPLAAPAILSSLILTFVFSVEDFGASYVLGHPHGIDTLSVDIYSSIQASFPPNYNFAAAVGCVMMLVTIVCVALQQRFIRSRTFTTVTGKASAQQVSRTGPGRWIGLAFNLLYALVVVVLPVLALLGSAFSRNWTGVLDPSTFTLSNFAGLVAPGSGALHSLGNSLVLSIGTATVVMALAIVVVYALLRQGVPGGRWLGVLLTLPVAVPGTVVAIGVLAWLLTSPLYGTLAIIAVGYGVRFFPYGQNAVAASLSAVAPELEEASHTSGVGRLGTLGRVLVPLLRPGIVSGWLLLFMIFMREVSISAMLWSSDTKPLSIQLINAILYQPAGQAAAFAVMQIVIVLIPAVLVVRLSGREALGGLR